MVPIISAHFESGYSSYLYDFVEFKRREGFKYNAGVEELQRLDRFFSSKNQTPECHSEEEIYHWLEKRPGESDKTYGTRNSIYRNLYNYLTDENISSIMPPPLNARVKYMNSEFVPYIFSHDEIQRMFEAADKEKHESKTFARCAPLFIRLLYGTGLRLNEALSLRVGDVLIDKGVLVILDSKNDKSRLVPVSPSLCSRLKQYIENNGYADDEPLFQSSPGRQLKDSKAYDWFRLIIFRAGIPHYGRGKGPRLHDLRHTFAVHSLQSAVERGIDPNAFLPILSVYLGHSTITATERYLRLTSEVFPYLTEVMDKIMNDIIPEVHDYEKR